MGCVFRVRGVFREGTEATTPKGRREAPSRLRPLTEIDFISVFYLIVIVAMLLL